MKDLGSIDAIKRKKEKERKKKEDKNRIKGKDYEWFLKSIRTIKRREIIKTGK